MSNEVMTLKDFVKEQGDCAPGYNPETGAFDELSSWLAFENGSLAENCRWGALILPTIAQPPREGCLADGVNIQGAKQTIRVRIFYYKTKLAISAQAFTELKAELEYQTKEAARGTASVPTQAETNELFALAKERDRLSEMLDNLELQLHPPAPPAPVPPPVPAATVAAAEEAMAVIQSVK